MNRILITIGNANKNDINSNRKRITTARQLLQNNILKNAILKIYENWDIRTNNPDSTELNMHIPLNDISLNSAKHEIEKNRQDSMKWQLG